MKKKAEIAIIFLLFYFLLSGSLSSSTTTKKVDIAPNEIILICRHLKTSDVTNNMYMNCRKHNAS